MKTLIIDNFTGRLTRTTTGKVNSGYARHDTTFGADPFSKPGDLTWFEQPSSINGLTLTSSTGPITGMKGRMEPGGTEYVYAADSVGSHFYRIQVNDTGGKNPNYDTASVINNAMSNSPTFRISGEVEFFGTDFASTSSLLSRIYVGGDAGVSQINSDGSGHTLLGNGVGSMISAVPRPLAQFGSSLYFGNGNNIGQISSAGTISSYSVLNPGFPYGTFVRDLDVTPDGNYLQITVTQFNQTSMAGNLIDSSQIGSADSYKFFWNGVDQSYTSYETYTGYALTANTVFANKNFTLGLDLGGGALYDETKKVYSFPAASPTNFSAMFSTGNLLGFTMPEFNNSSSVLQGSGFFYGQYDEEVPNGLYRFIKQTAVTGVDVQFMPAANTVSNLGYAPKVYTYTGNQMGSGKLYYSTTEIATNGTITPYLWRFTTVPIGTGSAIGGVYETQQQVFSKKIKVSQVRFYLEPLVTNNSFKIDLIGSSGNPISGGSKTFTAGTPPVSTGQDYVWYDPQIAPTYSIGVRITNLGTVNWTGSKLELDLSEGGK